MLKQGFCQNHVKKLCSFHKQVDISKKVYCDEITPHNKQSVLWIGIGFNKDQDPSFYLNADLDLDPGKSNECGSRWIRISLSVVICCQKFHPTNILYLQVPTIHLQALAVLINRNLSWLHIRLYFDSLWLNLIKPLGFYKI